MGGGASKPKPSAECRRTAELQTKNDQLRSELAALQRRCDRLQRDTADATALERDAAAHRDVVDALHADLASARVDARQARGLVKACETARTKLRARARVLERRARMPLRFSLAGDDGRTVPLLGAKTLTIELGRINVRPLDSASIAFVHAGADGAPAHVDRMTFHGQNGLVVRQNGATHAFLKRARRHAIPELCRFRNPTAYAVSRLRKGNAWVIAVDVAKCPLREVQLSVRGHACSGIEDVVVTEHA